MVRAVGPRTPPWIDLHVPGPALQLLSQVVELVSRRAVQPDLDAWPIAPAWLPDPGAHSILAAVMMRLFPDTRQGLPGCVHVRQQRTECLPAHRFMRAPGAPGTAQPVRRSRQVSVTTRTEG